MKANDVVFWLAMSLGATMLVSMFTTLAAQSPSHQPPPRFTVVSQDYVDSGAKVIVLRDARTGTCYVIYEAGVGAVLDKDVPCK